jgi:hypothetical protein
MKLNALLSGVILATAFTTASALTVATGNDPQPNQSNVLRNACGLATPDTGLSVQGCLNDDHSVIVDLSSDETLFINGGQATVRADDEQPFSTMTISTASMTSLILNIDATEDGFVTFTDGAGTSSPFELDASGQNFFTLTGIVGNSVTFVTSLTSGGAETDIVDEVRQIRIAGQVTAIPEPETYALMLAGLAAVGYISRRRRTKK